MGRCRWVAAGSTCGGGDGRLQPAESVVVVQVAADVGGCALMELVLGSFDGLFAGTALGELGCGDIACQTGMDGAVFAGGQDRSHCLIELVVRLLRGGVHCRCCDCVNAGRMGGAACRCYATVSDSAYASRARCYRCNSVSERG